MDLVAGPANSAVVTVTCHVVVVAGNGVPRPGAVRQGPEEFTVLVVDAVVGEIPGDHE